MFIQFSTKRQQIDLAPFPGNKTTALKNVLIQIRGLAQHNAESNQIKSNLLFHIEIEVVVYVSCNLKTNKTLQHAYYI